MLFDINSDYRALSFRGDTLFIVTEDRIITVDAATCSPTGYFTGEEADEEEPTGTETAEGEDMSDGGEDDVILE